MISFTDQEMIHEAGFRACFVRDLAEGDTIMIEHHLRQGIPTEMVVGQIHNEHMSDGHQIRKWIGTLPGEMQIHCSYGENIACWRKASQ